MKKKSDAASGVFEKPDRRRIPSQKPLNQPRRTISQQKVLKVKGTSSLTPSVVRERFNEDTKSVIQESIDRQRSELNYKTIQHF